MIGSVKRASRPQTSYSIWVLWVSWFMVLYSNVIFLGECFEADSVVFPIVGGCEFKDARFGMDF